MANDRVMQVESLQLQQLIAVIEEKTGAPVIANSLKARLVRLLRRVPFDELAAAVAAAPDVYQPPMVVRYCERQSGLGMQIVHDPEPSGPATVVQLAIDTFDRLVKSSERQALCALAALEPSSLAALLAALPPLPEGA